MIGLLLRRSGFRFASPVMALVGIAVAYSAAQPRVTSWADIEHVTGSAVALLAPVAAAVTAWDVTRESRHGARELLAAAARPTHAVTLQLGLAALIWSGLVMLVVEAAAIARALTIGLTGQPTLALALPWSTLVLAVALGAAAAALLPGSVGVAVAPVLPVLAFLAQFTPGGNPVFIALDPFRAVDVPADGFDFVPTTWTLTRLTIGAAFVLVLIALICVQEPRFRRAAGAMLLTATGLLTLGVVQASASRLEAIQPRPTAALTFTTVDRPGLRVQVLEQYAPVAGDVATRWARIAELVSDSSLAFDTLTQVPAVYQPGEAPRLDRLMLNPSSPDPAQDSIDQAIQRMLQDECATADPASWDPVAAVSVYLTRNADSAPVAADPAVLRRTVEHMNAMSVHEARTWFRQHASAFSTCTLTSAALPQ